MCSMISGQCDKLRERADEIQRIKNNNADWLWCDAATLADAAGQMRDAADLIWELRDDLQRVNAENAKMRELLSKVYGYYVSGTLTPCDFCDKYCCEGDASTTCKSDEYDPDGIVVKEVEQRMCELGVKP